MNNTIKSHMELSNFWAYEKKEPIHEILVNQFPCDDPV